MWFGSVEVASVPSWRVLFAICDSGKKVLQLRHFQVNIILHWQLQSDSISQRKREVHTNEQTRLTNTSYTTREHIFETDHCIAMVDLYLYCNLSLTVKYHSWYYQWEGVFFASERMHWIFKNNDQILFWPNKLTTRCQIWCTIELHRDPISKVLLEW